MKNCLELEPLGTSYTVAIRSLIIIYLELPLAFSSTPVSLNGQLPGEYKVRPLECVSFLAGHQLPPAQKLRKFTDYIGARKEIFPPDISTDVLERLDLCKMFYVDTVKLQLTNSVRL